MIKNQYQKFNKNYLKANKKIVIKDYFKGTLKIIKKKYSIKNPVSLIDMGCASGFFLEYFGSIYKNSKLSGSDFSSQLIEVAKKENPNMNFYVNNLLKKQKKNIDKFNITTCLGTLHAFDNLEMPLRNLFKVTKKKGLIVIFTLVNKYDVNVISRYQKNYGNDKVWYTAFNNFSRPYWLEKIKKINPKCQVKFHDFNLRNKLKKSKDPMRSWTERFGSNKKQLTVGTSQILNYKLIEIINN